MSRAGGQRDEVATPRPGGFLLGQPPGTLMVVGVLLLALGLVCEHAVNTLGWYYTDDRPVAFFGSYAAMHQSVALVRGMSNLLGYPLVLFGVARMVALAGAGVARRGHR